MSKLPFIIGNMATSFDGKLAPFDRSRLHMSCKEDFDLRDQIRTWVDGVLIGGTTLLSDNPTLTVKSEELKARRIERGLTMQPAGIALCGHRAPSPDNNFFVPRDSRRIILAGSDFNGNYDDVCCEIYKFDTKRPDIREAMKKLYERGITTILAEGGGTLMYHLLKEGLMSEFYVSVHPIIIGGGSSPTMFDGDGFSANEIRKINIIDNFHLSDGGIIYHCTVGNVKPRTGFWDNNFIIKE